MVKLDVFDIELGNSECAYFAGQEITGKVILETSEPKKISEILLELKGRARTYWSKHSGKSRTHVSHSEPYFLEQFNTNYTHKFTVTTEKKQERTLPAGRHEVPFSYTLPKTLPSSFEGEFGHVRYTCRAICERPWDFDIVSRKAFTVVGIEDINSEPGLSSPATASDSSDPLTFCCRGRGSVGVEVTVNKKGFTPGEMVMTNVRVHNESARTRTGCVRLVQIVTYKAKTFSGAEQLKTSKRVVVKKDKFEVACQSDSGWLSSNIRLPSLPPRLGKCKIIQCEYAVECEVEQCLTCSLPITIGSIPLLSDLLTHKKSVAERVGSNGIAKDEDKEDSRVTVLITDECGQPVDSDAMCDEMDALLSARKRVRMPSSILSELYPSMPSPYYRESHFGPVDISDEKESVQFGEKQFAPKYPFYTD